MSLLFSILLLIAFYLLLIAEFMLPTGGLLGVSAAATLIAAVFVAFSQSPTAGFSILGFAVVTTPMVFLGIVRVWPHTPIGRRMLNRRPGELAAKPSPRVTSDGTPLEELPGKLGHARTNLLPSGLVTVGGAKLDAVSIGMPIDAGTAVVVTSVKAGRVHVRPATEDDLRDDSAPTVQSPPSLEGSLESLDFD